MEKAKIVALLDKITEWSLYLLIFFIYGKTIIEGCVLVAFIAWGCKKVLIKDFRLKRTPLNWLLLAFLAANLISFVNADLRLLFMRSIVSKCIKFILLYFIIIETVDSDTKLKNLLKMAFISAVIITVDCYVQHFYLRLDLLRLYPSFKYAPATNQTLNYFGFPTGPFPFPNDLSAWMLMILIPVSALFLWWPGDMRTKFMLGSFLCPFSFLFYLASARSAWFGFFIAFVLMLFFQSRKMLVIFIALFLIFVLIVLIFLPQAKIEEISNISSTKDRFTMWRTSWDIFLEHPILGNGLNMFFHKYMEYRDDENKNKRGSHAHNGFLQMAADIGIVGLTIFLLLIARAFGAAFRYIKESKDAFYKSLSLGLIGGISAFLIHSFFDTNLHSLPLVTLFWFTLAVLMCIPNINVNET